MYISMNKRKKNVLKVWLLQYNVVDTCTRIMCNFKKTCSIYICLIECTSTVIFFNKACVRFLLLLILYYYSTEYWYLNLPIITYENQNMEQAMFTKNTQKQTNKVTVFLYLVFPLNKQLFSPFPHCLPWLDHILKLKRK